MIYHRLSGSTGETEDFASSPLQSAGGNHDLNRGCCCPGAGSGVFPGVGYSTGGWACLTGGVGDGVGKTTGAGWAGVGPMSGAAVGDGGSFTGVAVGIGLIKVVGIGVDVAPTVGVGTGVANIPEVGESLRIDPADLASGSAGGSVA